MRRETCLLVVLVAGTASLAIAADGDAGKGHAWRFPIVTTGDSRAWSLTLDPAVYAASSRPGDLADLAVVDADGRTVPAGPLPASPPRVSPASASSAPASSASADTAPASTTSSAQTAEHSATFAAATAGRHWLSLRSVRAAPATTGGVDYDYTLPAPLPVDVARITRADPGDTVSFTLENAEAGDAPLATIVTVPVAEAVGKPQFSTFGTVHTRRLRLHAAQALPIAPVLDVGWQPATWMFLADGRGPYRLLAGSRIAPRDDSAQLAAALKRLRTAGADANWRPPSVTLGAGMRLTLGGDAAPARSPFSWRRILPWAVLLLGGLIAASLSWKTLRRQSRENGRA